MCQIWLRSDRRECNAGMTIAKCTKTAASSNVSNHLSRTLVARFASGTAHHGRPYRNLGRVFSRAAFLILGSWLLYSKQPPCLRPAKSPGISGSLRIASAFGDPGKILLLPPPPHRIVSASGDHGKDSRNSTTSTWQLCCLGLT